MTIAIPKHALIVVADGKHAKLFQNTSEGGLRIESMGDLCHHNADDHLENHGASRTPTETTPREQSEAGFAKHVADDLYKQMHDKNVKAVVICADPQTLGQIRPHLHKEVTQAIVLELHKDLVKTPMPEIEKAIVHAMEAKAA